MSGCQTRQWTVRVHLTDYGCWCPDDAYQAAALIGVVNEMRRPQDGKPRVELWGGERTLVGAIDAESFTVGPGEHLVRSVLPDGSEEWGGMPTDLLARLDATRMTAAPTGPDPRTDAAVGR